MKNIFKIWILIAGVSIVSLSSCKKDYSEPAIPIASFQYQISETNEMEVVFRNYSKNATTYSWNFGDGMGTSTEFEPSYIFTEGGLFTVTLTASSNEGSAEHSKEVLIKDPEAANYILNGEFDDDSEWTIIQHNAANNGVVTIADGVANFDEIEDVPPGSWGSEAHVGINQMVAVEAGTYQLDLDITTGVLEESWFEVWVGKGEPTEGLDYNEDNDAQKVLSFNAWDCGAENSNYSGPMSEVSCQGTDGSVSLDAGNYYVVIRCGGFGLGEGGITIDNVTMVKVD
ncbi:MAG: hypothetical protein C0598_06400 [Marinilabiliales bacterium]|nr:MAG: hypothetical protein C0598_06400 [Marinilabiliales bacterium]